MKVLFVGLARTIWLFELALLNPTGMSLKGVIEEIGKRYRFAKVPANELDFDENRSLAFKAGTFTGARKIPLIVALNIYNDGLVGDTLSTTDESTEFLNDLGKWLSDTYGLTAPKDRRVNYVSQIDFQMEQPLANLNPQLQPFAEVIEGYVNTKNPLELSSLQFWPEGFGKPGSPAPIKIERKISAPFSANHYFSQAPLATSDHITLLTKFEALLKLEMK
jgi:hypothetical protein